jgi:hypothetical protein
MYRTVTDGFVSPAAAQQLAAQQTLYINRNYVDIFVKWPLFMPFFKLLTLKESNSCNTRPCHGSTSWLVTDLSPWRPGFISWVSPCGICGGQSGTGTRFSSSSSVFPHQYHSSMALNTHISTFNLIRQHH